MIILFCSTSSWAQGAPEFQNIIVSPTPFSPNGDGVRDVLNVTYEVTQDADWVRVDVKDSFGGQVVSLRSGGSQSKDTPESLTWNGKNAAGAYEPDGEYTLLFEAGNPAGQAQPQTWFVSLDATRPVVRFIEIYPNPFSPDLPGSPDSLRVRLSVSNSRQTDSLSILVEPEGVSSPETLRVTPSFAGDGEYAAFWRDSTHDDGLYVVKMSIEDSAGNRDIKKASFSLDTSAPSIGIGHPEDGSTFREIPDSLYGRAYDPAGVQSIELKYDAGDFTPIAFVTVQDTALWAAPLADSLHGSGEHTIEARATDGLGHTGAGGELGGPFAISVTRDNEAPPIPTLDPLPSMVRAASLKVLGRAPEADSVALYMNDFGAPVTKVVAGASGSFSGTVTLQPGRNLIAASSFDRAGNSSSISATAEVEFRQEFGIFFNERFRPGDSFEITLEEPAQTVSVVLYAMSGRLVRALKSDVQSTNFKISWDGTDHSGAGVNNGVYLCRVTVRLLDGSEISDKRLVALVR